MLLAKLTYHGQECIPVGCVPSAAVAVVGWGCLHQSMLGYVCPGGVSAPVHAGICLSGGGGFLPQCMLRYVCLGGCLPQCMLGYYCPGRGVCPSACWDTPTPTPHMNRIADACEKITFPQLRCGR